jgi:hypothetical protein
MSFDAYHVMVTKNVLNKQVKTKEPWSVDGYL